MGRQKQSKRLNAFIYKVVETCEVPSDKAAVMLQLVHDYKEGKDDALGQLQKQIRKIAAKKKEFKAGDVYQDEMMYLEEVMQKRDVQVLPKKKKAASPAAELCKLTAKGTFKRGIKTELVALAQQRLNGPPSRYVKMTIAKLCEILGTVEQNKSPVTEKKAPVTEKKAPVTEKKASVTEKKASVTEKKASVTENKSPVTEKKAPVTEKKALKPQSETPSTPVGDKKFFKGAQSFKHAYAQDACFSSKDPIPHYACSIMRNDRKWWMMKKMSGEVLYCLEMLHDKWVSGEDDFALLHANYLVDYYCTKVIELCEPDKLVKTVNDLKNVVLDSRALKYGREKPSSVVVSYDFFKKHVDYSTGLQLMVDTFIRMKDNVLSILQPHTREMVQKQKWDQVSPTELFDAIYTVERTLSEYHASGWGMYRLLYMNTFKGKNLVPNKGACSCICNSLLRSMMLILLGYPRGKVFTKLEASRDYLKYRKKQTHWAMTCEDVRLKVKRNWGGIDEYDDIGRYKLASSHAFIAYTRDIIYYYLEALMTYQVTMRHNKRYTILMLREMFDERLQQRLQVNARS
jgi:hypothetical protein